MVNRHPDRGPEHALLPPAVEKLRHHEARRRPGAENERRSGADEEAGQERPAHARSSKRADRLDEARQSVNGLPAAVIANALLHSGLRHSHGVNRGSQRAFLRLDSRPLFDGPVLHFADRDVRYNGRANGVDALNGRSDTEEGSIRHAPDSDRRILQDRSGGLGAVLDGGYPGRRRAAVHYQPPYPDAPARHRRRYFWF